MKLKKVILTIILIGFSFVFSMFEKASAQTPAQTPYSVELVPIKNQLKKEVSYFYALVKPGQTQVFSLKVKNNSQQKLTVVVAPHTARTSSGGSIDYSGIKTPLDHSLVYSFEELCSEKQTVTLDAQEEKIVTFTIKIPEKAFTGVLLGGFYIKEKTTTDQKQLATKKSGTITLNNEYSYIVGAVLTEEEEEKENFSFKLVDAKLAVWNHQFGVQAKIANQAPKIISKFTLQGYILRKKDHKKIHHIKEQTFSMAPNSIFLKAENLPTKTLPAGHYIYHLKITNPKTHQSWILEKELVVTKAKRKSVIQHTLAYETMAQKAWLKWLVVGLTMAVVILIVIVLYLSLGKRGKRL